MQSFPSFGTDTSVPPVMYLASSLAFLVLGTSLTSAASFDRESLLDLKRTTQTAAICSTLSEAFPGQIELPGSSNYTTETTSKLPRIDCALYIVLVLSICRLLVLPELPPPILRLRPDYIS